MFSGVAKEEREDLAVMDGTFMSSVSEYQLLGDGGHIVGGLVPPLLVWFGFLGESGWPLRDTRCWTRRARDPTGLFLVSPSW